MKLDCGDIFILMILFFVDLAIIKTLDNISLLTLGYLTALLVNCKI